MAKTRSVERGLYGPLYDVINQQPPLPDKNRTDGPFILLHDQFDRTSTFETSSLLPLSGQSGLTLSTGGVVSEDLVLHSSIFQGVDPAALRAGGGRNGRIPAVILVAPDPLRIQNE